MTVSGPTKNSIYGSGYYKRLRNRNMRDARRAKAHGYSPIAMVERARLYQHCRLTALRAERARS